MMQRFWMGRRHPLAAAICFSLLLTSGGPAVYGRTPAVASSVVWPQPQVQTPLEPGRAVQVQIQMVPNFRAPSATSCNRAPVMREVPGGRSQGGWAYESHAEDRFVLSRSDAMPLRDEISAPVPAAAPPVAPTVAARPSPVTGSSSVASERVRGADVVRPEPGQQTRVTAGMVDDNADFGEYLAYLKRHAQVVHRERDVSERHVLWVRDEQGRSVPDAEVAIMSQQGAAMWARTDAAGRVWVHPNAFDPQKTASTYQVYVRKGDQQTQGILRRADRSALELVLPSVPVAQRAQLDLVFLIDSTGSMGDEIAKLRASLKSITAEVAQLPSQPDLCLGLVTYRDQGDAYLLRSYDMTNDVDAFQRILNQLQANGGGDEPEAMNEAFNETVHNLSWRGSGATRLVVLLADAPPHLDYGGPQYDDDMVAALGMGIKVFSVGASGLNEQGEYIQRQIAQYTGGKFVFLTYKDASNPASGPGTQTVHDVRNYSVETLDQLIVRLVREELAYLPSAQ